MAYDSEGTAAKEQEKYMESLQAKIDQVKASWQALSNSFLSSDFLKGLVDGGKTLLDIIDGIVKAFGSLGTIGATVGVVEFVKNFKDLQEFGKKTKALKEVKAIMSSFGTISQPVEKIGVALQGLSDKSKVAILGLQGLSEEQLVIALQASGMNAGLAATTAAEITAGVGATTASVGFKAFAVSIAEATEGLIAFLLTDPVGWAILATGAVLGVTKVMGDIEEAAEEARQAAEDKALDFSESKQEIDDYVSKIQELRTELDSGKLTESEAYDTKKQLLEIQNQLKESYGDEASAIDLVNGKLDEQISKVQNLSVEEAKRLLVDNSTQYDEAKKELSKTLGGDGGWFSEKGMQVSTLTYANDLESAYGIDKINKVFDKYKDNLEVNKYTDGLVTDVEIRFIGNAEDAQNTMVEFGNELNALKNEVKDTSMLDNLLDGSSAVLTESDSVLEKWSDIYEKQKQAQMIVDSYGDDKKTYQYGNENKTALELINGYTEVINAYNDALLQNDETVTSKARSDFESYQTMIDSLLQQNPDLAEYSEFFTEVASALNSAAISAKDFDDAMTGSNAIKDAKNLTKLKVTDVDFKTATLEGVDKLGDGEVESAIKGVLEEYAKDYGIGLSDITQEQIESIASDLVDKGVLTKSAEQITTATREQMDKLRSGFGDLDISQWFFNLSQDEKNLLALHIDVDADNTKLWTLSRWQEELQKLSETGKSTSEQMQEFYDILGTSESEGLSKDIDEYTEKLSKLEEARSKFTKGEMSKEEALNFAMEFPELSQYLNDTDAMANAIQNLIDTSNQDINNAIDEAIKKIGDDAPDAVAALEMIKESVNSLATTDSGWNFSLDDEIEKFKNFYSAISESASATGLSTESINNIKAMYSGLESYDPSALFERTSHGIHMNVSELRTLQTEYEKQKKSQVNTHLQELITEYNQLASELEGVTDASERADKLSKMDGLQKKISETADLASQYDALTSSYNKWIEAQSTTNENDMYMKMSDGIETIKEAYEEGWTGTDDFLSAVQLMTNKTVTSTNWEDYYNEGITTQEKFFTGTTEGLANFIDTVKSVQGENNWITEVLNEDGTKDYKIDFGVGGDEKIAEAISQMDGLEMSTEQVQILMRALSAAGFDINLDSLYTQVDDFTDKLKEAQEAGVITPEVNFDYDKTTMTLDEIIAKEKELENAKLSIDADTEEGQKAIETINDEINALKSQEIVTSVKTQLDDGHTLEELAAMDDKTLMTTVGVDDSRVQEVRDEIDLMKTDKIDIAIQTQLDKGTTMEELEAMDDKTLVDTLDIDSSDVEDARKEMESLNGQTVESALVVKLDESQLSQLTTTDKNVSVNATASGNDLVQSLKTQIDAVKDKTIKVSVDVDEGQLDSLKTSLESFGAPKQVSVNAETGNSKENVDALKKSIESVNSKSLSVVAGVIGTNMVNALKSAIDRLYSRSVVERANVYGTNEVNNLKAAIDRLYNKTVTITHTTNNVTNNITNNKKSPYNGTANVNGSTFANGTAFAKGNWGLPQNEKGALVGE